MHIDAGGMDNFLLARAIDFRAPASCRPSCLRCLALAFCLCGQSLRPVTNLQLSCSNIGQGMPCYQETIFET